MSNPVVLIDFDFTCENFLVVFVVLLQEIRGIQLIRAMCSALSAFDAGIDLCHFFLPVLV